MSGTEPEVPDAPAAPEAPPPAPPEATPAPAPERPEWLPEGVADGPALAKSYTELRAAFSKKNETLQQELLGKLREGVPAKPEDYALEVPPDLLPEGMTAAFPADDPFLGEMRGLMHSLGAKPEQFQAAANAFLRWQIGNMPDVAAEKVKLGEGAPERIAALDMWLAKTLDKDAYGAVAASMTSAKGIEALEKLMGLATGGGVRAATPGGAAGGLTPEAAADIMRRPEYRQASPEGDRLRAQFNSFVQAGGRLPGYGAGGFSRGGR